MMKKEKKQAQIAKDLQLQVKEKKEREENAKRNEKIINEKFERVSSNYQPCILYFFYIFNY